MIKLLMMMKRKSDLTREQCLEHWKEVHGPKFLQKKVPGMRGYTQNHAIEADTNLVGPGFDTDIDGIAEFWFDDAESAQAFMHWHRTSDEAKDLREDVKLFANYKGGFYFLAEEHVMKK